MTTPMRGLQHLDNPCGFCHKREARSVCTRLCWDCYEAVQVDEDACIEWERLSYD